MDIKHLFKGFLIIAAIGLKLFGPGEHNSCAHLDRLIAGVIGRDIVTIKGEKLIPRLLCCVAYKDTCFTPMPIR